MYLMYNEYGARQSECYSLAMAYVPWQEAGSMYSPLDALKRGTLFPELFKPFCGKTIAS